ncbi:MAG: chitobiase/beta-hexosaminidase C-terminal domain-containing protein [Clostridiales bacterium]|nr:chitobiase/beta-hexosaminidase C-terminal domain-containing protein [Clostridiales bacterium]
MKDQNRFLKKFHKVRKQRRTFRGMLCLFLAVLMLCMIPEGTALEAEAAGSIGFNKDDPVWSTSSGDQITRIDGFSVSQSLTANKVSIKTNGTTQQISLNVVTDENGIQTMPVDISYLSNAAFSVDKIDAYTSYTRGTPYLKEKNAEDTEAQEASYDLLQCSSGQAVTYYKVVTNPDAKYSFTDFETKVRDNYKKEAEAEVPNRTVMISENMLMSTGWDRRRTAYDTAIKKYMEEAGGAVYTAGTGIPLLAEDQQVVRIDMLTCTGSDLYFSISNDNGLYKHMDFDISVYQQYSYTFKGPSMVLEPPKAELESGKTAGTDAVSADDTVTALQMVNTAYEGDTEKEIYEKGYQAGQLQYCLSSRRITDPADGDWKDWTQEIPVSLEDENKKYLYTRIVAGEGLIEGYTFQDSETREYSLTYITEELKAISSRGETGMVLEGSRSEDKVTLKSEDEGALIFYTLNEELPESCFMKADAALKEVLDQQGRNHVYYDGGQYVQGNGLWYRVADGLRLYDESRGITAGYQEQNPNCMEIRAVAFLDGKKPDSSVDTFRYLKLEAPTIRLESGKSVSEGGVINISQEDSISSIEKGSNPYTSGDADYEAYQTASINGALEYYLSDTAVTDWQDIVWAKWDENSFSAKLFLYVRMVPDDSSDSCMGSDIRLYNLKYIEDPYAPNRITVQASAGTAVTEDSSAYGDQIRLETDDADARIFYTMNEEMPEQVFQRVNDPAITEVLNTQCPGDQAADSVYNEIQYIRVNGLWYQCADSVKLYTGPFTVGYQEGNSVEIQVLALADGYAVSSSVVSHKLNKLEAPTVTLESGSAITDLLSSDDCVIHLNNPYGETAPNYAGYGTGTWQYYLSDRKMERIPNGSWINWTGGDPLSLNRKTYLYTRFVTGEEGYVGSAPCEYPLNYLTAEPGVIDATAYVGDEVIEGGVDYGDKIELIELTASEEKAMIFYTIDGSKPSFKKVASGDRERLDEAYGKSEAGSILLNENGTDVRYMKVNNLWYQCGASTFLYEDKIVVDEEIYEDNYLTVNAQAILDDCIISAPDRFTYSFSLRNQVIAPAASPENGAEVEMGSLVNLLCETPNSRIFYTLNGSAPVVTIRGAELVLGENTYEYTGTPITITDAFAEYGSSVTITAQAGCYGIFNGLLSRTMKDSPLARFTYKVGAQTVVSTVTSVPATSADIRAEVEIGSLIHLYSGTEGASIFYTLDGTEPVFDEETLEPKNDSTRKYNPSSGIQVPEITESSLLTITAVAYKDGLAASDVARLIFQYPSAVSAPYASPSAGSVTEGTLVTLKSATEGAVIYYEIAYGDETPKTPTEDSNVFDPSNPFAINKKTTIRAYAVKNGMDSPVSTFTYQVADKLSTPEPTIASGSVVAAGTVVGLEADEGATIYYTVDGSDPKKADNKNVLVGESVIINGDVGAVITIRTYAARNGYSDSELGYYSYSISAYEGGIFADLESGSTVKNGETIHLNTDVSDADIYYTTDGSTPTTDSAQGSTVTISGAPGENVIVKAIAIAEGTDTAISSATFTYTIMDKLAGPSASVPDGAVFTEEGTVTLTSESGKIYYTTNGEDPSTASNLYKRAIVVDRSMTIKAVAVDEDYEQSEISTFTYGFADQVAAPQANFASGELEMGTTITFTCETEGASIYYRTDGTDPDPDDKSEIELYTGPILIEKAVNFKVIAVKEHMQDSKVVSVGYTVREPAVAEEAVEEESQTEIALGGRLQSRRSFSGAETGPSFTDIVLRNATYQVVVSGEEGSLPDNVQLKVEPTQVTEASQRMVKQMLSDTYGVVASYEVNLLVNDEEVEPEGEIEIGLPIPADYANSIIHIVHLEEDGSIEIHDARRSGGIAYAKVDKLHTYSIAAPVEYEEEEGSLPWLLILYITAVSSVGLLVLFLYRSRKKKKEGGDWYA